ncbi:MAG: hypothetical protein OEW78_01910 [Nitrosopumilus sp.]|uniref:hypothetical protein n=1 Tax=Nitrosopumilus sp. TaxID=2024843 RepID=UPI00246D4E73|nr:hypothetical protein [Nitrosopumilus sp.]MDH5430624.1 hypothetical protein [Nitrosopumilus sp.]MDH5665008.1 hypothetical protein [Nitrosopumilus sp.]MDH5696959.1 hypothetical protein [Nitrosopumilus sp.]
MKSSKKTGIIVLFVLAISIFSYSQYAFVSQIGVSISQSELSSKDEKGSNYNVELRFENPSLLILTAGETEFFIISNDEIIGKGNLESFSLQPLDNSYVKGTFHTDANSDESKSIRISGITKYDMVVTSIDIPFVYYPTEEQTREFIHQN